MNHFLLPLGLALCCAASCGAAKSLPKDSPLIFKAGQDFEIKLPSLATAGYEWHVLENYDKKLVAFLEKRLGELPKNAPLGRSADEVFVFKALKSGHLTLAFVQYRPWEGPEKASEKKEVEIRIDP